ncbi:hypothetical protein DSO57_1029054 [Entomophthora muscae]|uniref:Uncharacterized protein n=1 Tax=Entomophthora muscae TaxID=34485 RepID=A0ACC2T1T5_9FUNG|nr:hypothetical protein DSO57_1029054 [Entomophthora muscae]
MKDRLDSLDLSGEKALLTPSTEHDQCIYSSSSSLPGSPFAGDTTKTFEEARLEPLDRFYSSCHPIAEKLEVKGWKQSCRFLIYNCKNDPLYISRFDDIFCPALERCFDLRFLLDRHFSNPPLKN